MGFFSKSEEEKKKEAERQAAYEEKLKRYNEAEAKRANAEKEAHKKNMRPSPAREFLGQELYAVDCRGANLYIHTSAVVIDKTGGGLFNAGDNNFKVIPFKSIVAIQAKLKSTVLTGYVEFETANSPLSTGSDSAERQSENSVVLSGTDERYDEVKTALKYVFDHIC